MFPARPRIDLSSLAEQLGGIDGFLPRALVLRPADFKTAAELPGGYFMAARSTLPEGDYLIFFCIDILEYVEFPRLVFDAVLWDDHSPKVIGDVTHCVPPGSPRTAFFSLRFSLAESGKIELRAWSDTHRDRLRIRGAYAHRFDDKKLARAQGLQRLHGANYRHWRGLRARTEAIPYNGEGRLLEIWLAFDQWQTANPIFQIVRGGGELGSGPTEETVIEFVGAQQAAPFIIGDGRLLLHLTFPSPLAAEVSGYCKITIRLGSDVVELGMQRIGLGAQALDDTGIAAVCLLLRGRLPENQSVYDSNHGRSVRDLTTEILGSAEFREDVLPRFLPGSATLPVQLGNGELALVKTWAQRSGIALDTSCNDWIGLLTAFIRQSDPEQALPEYSADLLNKLTQDQTDPSARPAAIERVRAAEEQPLQSHINALRRQLDELDAGWRQHVPAFLNAVASVGAFGREQARLRREVEALRDEQVRLGREIEALRTEIADADQSKRSGPPLRRKSAAGGPTQAA